MKAVTAEPAVTAAAASNPIPSARWALAGLSLSMLLSTFAASSANIALPTLAEAFGASFRTAQWVVLAYLLAITCLIVGVGRLGDIAGRRRVLVAGLLVFVLASAACGAAPTLPALIAARAVQGVGAAALMALTMAFVGGIVPKARTGAAMGLLSTMSAVGTALGPSLGGLLVGGFGWRSIFLVNLPLGLLAMLLAWRHLPADRPVSDGKRPGFDVAGTLLLALSLAAYALAVTVGRGSFGSLNVALLLAAAMGLVLFVVVEARAAAPLIRLAMLRDPALSASLAVNALVTTVIMSTMVVGPFYLSRALGLDAATIGLVVAVGPTVVALTGVPAGRLADRFGPRPVVMAGLVVMAAGAMLLSLLPSGLGVPGYAGPLAMVTGGYALFQTANNTAVMAGVPAERRGLTSGLLNLSRNLGFVSGASVMGAVFALASGAADIVSAPPAAVAAGMHGTFAVAAVLIAGGLAISIGAGIASRRTVARDVA